MQASVRAPLPAVRCHGGAFLQPHQLLTPRCVSVRAQQEDSSVDRQPGPAGAQHQDQNDLTKAQGYYAGLLKSDLNTTNNASSADMLSRSLQLAGGFAALLALLTFGFLASNGLV